MPHQILAGVGVTAELAGEEGAVVVVWVVLDVHGVAAQRGQHLPQPLPVVRVVVEPGGLGPRHLGLGGGRELAGLAAGLLLEVGGAAHVGGGRLLLVAGRRLGQHAPGPRRVSDVWQCLTFRINLWRRKFSGQFGFIKHVIQVLKFQVEKTCLNACV